MIIAAVGENQYQPLLQKVDEFLFEAIADRQGERVSI